MGTNQQDAPPGSNVLEGSIADRLRDLEAIVARIKEQRHVNEENFQACMKQHEIEADQWVAVDRELKEALARQMSYAIDKIGGHERRAGEHEKRHQRLEGKSSNNMFIFDDIDGRLVELVQDQRMGHRKATTLTQTSRRVARARRPSDSTLKS